MYFRLYEDSMSNLLNFKYLFLISMMSNLLMSKIASQLSIKNFDIYLVTTSLLNFWFIQKIKIKIFKAKHKPSVIDFRL